MPHRLLCALCALLLLPFAAQASEIPTSMTVALISPPDQPLYPLLIKDRDMLSMLNLVYDSMVVLDDNRQPVPSIATSWKVIGSGKTWVFQIRQGVKFHNGSDLTAFDIAATMDAIRVIATDPNLADTERGMYYYLNSVCSNWSVEAADPYTLTVQTERPCYGLLYAMTFPILQSQATMEQNPPGTGPYRIEYYMPGEELWLVGNQEWYGPPPYISELEGRFFKDIDAALTAFESEDVDIVMTRSTSAVRYRGTASTRSSSYDFATRQLECLLFNSSKYLKDIRMRQAISHALNKVRLTSNVYQNMVIPTDTLQSPDSWLYNDSDDVTTFAYDPAAADVLFDELGWENINDAGYRFRKNESGETEVLELRLFYYDEAGNSLRKEAATEIADMLRAVGIRVRTTSYSFENATQKLLARDYDLFLCAYNFDVVPDPNFILLSNGYGNYVNYRSEAMNELCQTLRKSYEAENFQQAWYDIQALLSNDVPFLPLYWREGVVLTRYPFSSVRDIREFELLKSINEYK